MCVHSSAYIPVLCEYIFHGIWLKVLLRPSFCGSVQRYCVACFKLDNKSKFCHNCYSVHAFSVSSVGIATGYGLDCPGIESRWGEIFHTCPDLPWGPPNFLYNGYRVFPGGEERPGRDVDPSPLLVPWSWKGRAIPLLPLWAVRPVQSLSACTRVTFTFYSHAFSSCRTSHCTERRNCLTAVNN